MSKKYIYSDEYISAYIDGELDAEERARLLYDEQTDEDLAQRINETRMLKEKVQLTYADIDKTEAEPKSFSCSVFVGQHRVLVASLLLLSIIATVFTYNIRDSDSLIIARQLIKNTPAVPVAAISDIVGTNEHVVINVSQYDPANFSETITSIEALLQSRDSSSFKVEIVANGQGLKVLDTQTSPHADQLEQLTARFENIDVVACAKSLAEFASDGDPVQLMKSIMITPSAAAQVAKRTAAGWVYVKI